MDELKTIRCVKRATDNIEQALSCAHHDDTAQEINSWVEEIAALIGSLRVEDGPISG